MDERYLTRVKIPLRSMTGVIEKGFKASEIKFVRRRDWAKKEGVAMVLDVPFRAHSVKCHLESLGLRFLTSDEGHGDVITMI